jgi:hypothetical protein
MKPTALGHDMSNRAILSLSAGTRHRRLALGGPRDQVVAEEDVVARRRAPGVWTARPVHVGVRGEGVDRPGAEVETGGQSTLHVAQDALDQHEMRLVGIVLEEAHLLDRK